MAKSMSLRDLLIIRNIKSYSITENNGHGRPPMYLTRFFEWRESRISILRLQDFKSLLSISNLQKILFRQGSEKCPSNRCYWWPQSATSLTSAYPYEVAPISQPSKNEASNFRRHPKHIIQINICRWTCPKWRLDPFRSRNLVDRKSVV